MATPPFLLSALPTGQGLQVVRSHEITRGALHGGICLVRNPAGTQFWACDYLCGIAQAQLTHMVIFGPFNTVAEARVMMSALDLIDNQNIGTNGTSTWLTPPP